MNPLIKYWQISLLVLFILVSLIAIGFWGIKFGMDFNGGTLYQIELQKGVSSEEISRIATIISQRVDPSGLKDATVYPVGNQYIVVQLSETNPAELEKIEGRIRQQGKFESALNGEVVFTGDEILRVLRGDNSYGVFRLSDNAFEWSLPFVLNSTAVKSFKEKTFHQCNAVSFSSNGTPVYDCEKTVFFLDKPNALIVISEEQFDLDSQSLFEGNMKENIPAETSIDELIEDSQLKVMIIDDTGAIDYNLAKLALEKTSNAIVSFDAPQKTIDDLNSLGFSVLVSEKIEEKPWIWSTLNARQIIRLTDGITNEDVADITQAKEFSTLRISGQRETVQEARADLEELAILLESGSLPTPVKTISKETISPSLGESFASNVLLMGLIAAIIVALIIFIRYRTINLVAPILLTGFSEIIIMMGFLAFTQRPLDLAAFAGIIAAIGTGVDSEIVITEEIMGKTKTSHESLIHRAKNALFIIITSAFTTGGVMLPIILFSRSLPGLDKLFGFAVVTIIGAVIGIFISRPAFTKLVESIVQKKEREELK